MLTPVVIGTHPERTHWLNDCLTSIKATTSPRRRIHIHQTGGYEPAAILDGCQQFDRFLFIHDSVTILSRDFWTTIDASGPAWLAGAPHMFLAIYNAATVQPALPTTELTKSDAIHWENHLPAQLPPMPVLWPNVTDATALRHETRHGRDNKVLGVDGIWEKHKGNWGQT